MMKGLKVCLAAVAAIVLSAGAAQAQTRIQGGGASFPAPIYAKWVAMFNEKNPDLKVDYQPSGSGAGIKGVTDRTLAFGGTDALLSADQEKKLPAKALHIPTVAGPVVMIYNLEEIGAKELKLSGEVVAGIYLKEITTWNDPKIVALNPGLELPAKPVVVVHRSDGSGTSFIFTDYLSKVSKTWAEKVGKGTSVSWPVGIGGRSNSGVAQNVQNTAGSIGYVESAYATTNKIPYATQINQAGKAVKASVESVEAAAANALKVVPDDLKVSITNAEGDDSYPICGFTYLLVYEDLSYMNDEKLAAGLVKFVDWAVTDGQASAKDLGYAKLPKEVAEKVHTKVTGIKFNGKSLVK